MVKKSTENGHSIPPFLHKCYEMVDDPTNDAVISWGPTGDSFLVVNDTKFTSELLPKYFKHSNFSSFQRQLNIYGFRKTDTDRWEFANDGFIKDQKHMLKYIIRRKPSQAAVLQKPTETENKNNDVEKTQELEDKNSTLWKEVECLITDKNMLMQELAKLRQHQQTSQTKLSVLREQLKGMEKHQQQMLSFIVMAMQSPDFLVQFFQPKENNYRIVTEDCEEEEIPFNGTIVPYQPPENISTSTPTSNSGDSFELHKDFFKNIDFMLGRPFDEKLTSPKSHDPFVLSYLPDSDSMLDQLLSSCSTLGDNKNGDSMLERLLSSSPTLEDRDNGEEDDEDVTDTGMEVDPTLYGTHQVESEGFEFIVEGFDKSLNMGTDSLAFETGLVDSSPDEVTRHLSASESGLKNP